MTAALRTLLGRISGVVGELVDGTSDVFLFGSMAGSAIVSPVLIDAPNVWHLSVITFFHLSLRYLTLPGIYSYSWSHLAASPSGTAKISRSTFASPSTCAYPFLTDIV